MNTVKPQADSDQEDLFTALVSSCNANITSRNSWGTPTYASYLEFQTVTIAFQNFF
jgi:hypothetical protein